MEPQFPRSTARLAGHPIHPMLVPFPMVFFISALLTDIAYLNWGGMWAYASTWLIGAGIISGLLAGLFGFVDYMGEPRIRALRPANWHLAGNLLAIALSVVNFLVHNRDGAVSVLPWGITLSAIVSVLLLFNAWMGAELVYRHGVAVMRGGRR